MAKGKYKVVSLSTLIQTAKCDKDGSPRVVVAVESLDKPIVATFERKGETYFVTEA